MSNINIIKKFTNIENVNKYNNIRNEVKDNLKKTLKENYKDKELEYIRIEKERCSIKINDVNSPYIAIAISLLAMFFSCIISVLGSEKNVNMVVLYGVCGIAIFAVILLDIISIVNIKEVKIYQIYLEVLKENEVIYKKIEEQNKLDKDINELIKKYNCFECRLNEINDKFDKKLRRN